MVVWPQELLEAFVGQIPDKITLQRCSLASKSLVVASQRRLFHSVSVKDRTSIRRATQQFTAFPHLRPYVKELDVTSSESTTELKELASLLHMFPDVTRIKWSGFEWPKFLVTALKESLQNPSMQSFTLMVCDDVPPSLLSHAAASVSQLTLWHVTLNDRAGPAAEVIPSSQLRHLSHNIASMMGKHDTILPLLPHLSGLEKLEDDLSSVSEFKLIMEASHETLKKLYLRRLDLPKLAHISRTPPMHSLRVLDVSFVYASSKLCILALFSALPPPMSIPHLETLSMYIGPADTVPVPQTAASGLREILDAHGELRTFHVELGWRRSRAGLLSLAEYIRAQTPTRIRVSGSISKQSG
ncbi:hypothetical protein FB45DRAFT_1064387 [Roridomyces roridus]|uniref:Uncharacterized protein n=1 Tax=Roridomyces roridus TaxID=1738132 RepID=A0AAD7BAG2_9AGAR|nr:hypothetical protein FB45DRAFT_1064387 [Roridomyces roridus]